MIFLVTIKQAAAETWFAMHHFNPQAMRVFVGLFMALLFASAVGWWLRRRFGNGRNPTLDNLVARINAWWVMTAVLLFAFWLGRVGVIALFFLVSLVALREFMAQPIRQRGEYVVLVSCFFVVLPLQYGFVLSGWYGMFSVFIPVYGFLLLPILASFVSDTTQFLSRAAKVQWAVMICIFCLSHVPALMNLKIEGFEGKNVLLLIFLIAVVQLSDVLQYIWGKLLGHRKIMPSLSPSKTVAGTVGGIGSATAVAGTLVWITPFTLWQALLLGFIIALMGFLGGLVMSAIKRDRGVKDWGNMIHGHGGMLDRVDSLCFSAPVFFHLVRYYWHG